LPEEAAEVKMTALMMWGRAGIPAFWIAITQGDFRAPDSSELVSFGSLELTVTPIASEPST
jgi:hypothetical protein